VLDLFGRIPDERDEMVFQGLRFTVEHIQGRRVATVLIAREPGADETHEEVVGG
jgi:CBS domain containing-hemolysin-like protein